MSDQFVAEVRIFPFNFPPTGWAFCDGQLMPISQNTALFSLLGTTYGGDGKSTFSLPNLQGCAAVQPGQGFGSLYDLGEMTGTESVTLLQSEMPAHTHQMKAHALASGTGVPSSQVVMARAGGSSTYTSTTTPVAVMAPQALTPAGGGLPHNNMMPYLTVNFCIALQGIFPPRP